MITVVLVFLILCCYWAYWSASTRKLVKQTAKLPVPPGLPILGHATLFVGNTENASKRFFKVWLQPDCFFNLTPYAKQQKENIELTHNFTNEVVRKRRLHYETRKNQNTNDQSDGNIKAVLDLLFGHEINFTDEQLREHIDSITIAGNDTTALVISYTLVLLGIHQYAQEKVVKEQQSIFGTSKQGATKEDLLSMIYLERVIKETYSQVTVPTGVGAVVGLFAVHRSSKEWGPNANEFDPDRFLPERSANRHPAAFLPFSLGSRNCIGRNFGMIVIKSLISSIIRAYKIEAREVGPLKVEMLLFPIRGHQIKITKR